MFKFATFLNIFDRDTPNTPVEYPPAGLGSSPFKLLRDRTRFDSLTTRDLAPFLQFISQKQLLRLHLETLPALGAPPHRTMHTR